MRYLQAGIVAGAVIVALTLTNSIGNAQPALQRDDAINAPSKHAWDLFQLVNHPAMDPKTCQCRGVADPSKAMGQPGTFVVWETWRLSSTEVFLAHGAKPPAWDDESLPGGPVTGKVPDLPKPVLMARLAGKSRLPSGPHVLFDPGDGIFAGHGQFGESRMNKATYNFVVDNGLFSIEGQQRYAQSVLDGSKPVVAFPLDSMEVKAAWVDLSDTSISDGNPQHYYTADYKGKKYGLASLHIITKDLPNWFWATFHHVSNPAGGAETHDDYGRPDSLNGTVWKYYVLGGTQTNFTDSIGRPTLLSDSLVEKGIENSSCISCHARATVAPTGFSSVGNKPVLGVPNPAEYMKDGKPFLSQTDFLFSLPIRAQSEKE